MQKGDGGDIRSNGIQRKRISAVLMLHEDQLRQVMLRVSPLEAEENMDLPRLSQWALSD